MKATPIIWSASPRTFRADGALDPAAQERVVEQHERPGEADLKLAADHFEFGMRRCPSLAKVIDNDAAPCALSCDHCMSWVEPATEATGLDPVFDMESRAQPHCAVRVYTDPDKARAFAQQMCFPARPYEAGKEEER